MTEKLPAIELVTWQDISCNEGWHIPGETAYTPLQCQTVGWVIKETPDHIVVAPNVVWGENHQVSGAMTIPLTNVSNRQAVKVG